ESQQHGKVANTVGDHGLAGGVAVLPAHTIRLVEPEANEQERTHAHAFPTNKHHHEIVARDEYIHKGQKHIEIGEEARVTRVAVHVTAGEDVDERRHKRDEQHHRHTERVHTHLPRNIHRFADTYPVREEGRVYDHGFVMVTGKIAKEQQR